jgi:hypothetical protein
MQYVFAICNSGGEAFLELLGVFDPSGPSDINLDTDNRLFHRIQLLELLQYMVDLLPQISEEFEVLPTVGLEGCVLIRETLHRAI